MKSKTRICKSVVIDQVLHEFKDSELKTRDNKVVKNSKQAVAIALSKSDRECPQSVNLQKVPKAKLVEYMKKSELQKVARDKKIKYIPEATKAELGRMVRKSDIISFLEN